MPRVRRRVTKGDLAALRLRVERLVRSFDVELKSGGLRAKVLALVPIFHALRDLGKALVPREYASAARDRVLYYFQQYPEIVIAGDELLVVSGIQEYARRVRELRVQLGWPIASGVTIAEMSAADAEAVPPELARMTPSDYVLLGPTQDREAATRWHVANSLRKKKGSVRDKLLEFLRANVGRPVTGEELRYVAGNRTEWARRVRELRTEHGWPIATKTTGRPELNVGIYVLEADRQSPEHDRRIPDDIRRAVLRRDRYKCAKCGWTNSEWNRDDPRHLELHHKKHHVQRGDNTEDNLTVLCNVCHDKEHRKLREHL
jgi:hypothetical protein